MVVAMGLLWALACLGLRLRLHGRLLAAGAPLPELDQVLKNLGGPWLRRVAVAAVVVALAPDPGVLRVVARGIGLREVLVVVAAGAFRLFSTATLWAELRAVDDHRLHRLDLRTSLIWETAFWMHTGLTLLPTILWS